MLSNAQRWALNSPSSHIEWFLEPNNASRAHMAATEPVRHDAYVRAAREVLSNRVKRDCRIAMMIAQLNGEQECTDLFYPYDEGDIFDWNNSTTTNLTGLIENQLVRSFTLLMATRKEQP